MEDTKGSVLVTGCSKGIGYCLVEVLVAEGYHIFGSVRKETDAIRLQKDFGASFTPLIFDIVDEAAVQKAAVQVRDALKGRTLLGVVNNAGYCHPAPFMHLPVADFKFQVEANLMGTFIVSQAFTPQLGADRTLTGPPGRILNISSCQGKMGTPFLCAYSAAKHAVEGLSECMRRELKPYGIDVVIVAPGFVKTPIFDKTPEQAIAQYIGSAYRDSFARFLQFLWWSGQEDRAHEPAFIAREIYNALIARSPKARYSPIAKRWLNWTVPLMLPVRWVDSFLCDRLGLNAQSMDMSKCPASPKAGESPQLTPTGKYYVPQSYIVSQKKMAELDGGHPELDVSRFKSVHVLTADGSVQPGPKSVEE